MSTLYLRNLQSPLEPPATLTPTPSEPVPTEPTLAPPSPIPSPTSTLPTPSPIPSPTLTLPTPSPIPTFTPTPTADTAVAPPEVTVGFYAQVVNTDGFGVTVRGGSSTSSPQITIADEGSLLLVIGGPEADSVNDRLWWEIQLADGNEGWVAGEFLAPAAGP